MKEKASKMLTVNKELLKMRLGKRMGVAADVGEQAATRMVYFR